MSFNVIHENKILAKISEFSLTKSQVLTRNYFIYMYCVLQVPRHLQSRLQLDRVMIGFQAVMPMVKVHVLNRIFPGHNRTVSALATFAVRKSFIYKFVGV